MTEERFTIPAEYLIYKVGILKKALFIILALSFASLFFLKSFSLGFFVGALISMANFSLLSKYILKMRDLMRDFSIIRAKRFIVVRFLIMYFIMGLALFIGATKGIDAFLGTALGLLVIKFTIFIDGILAKYVKSS